MHYGVEYCPKLSFRVSCDFFFHRLKYKLSADEVQFHNNMQFDCFQQICRPIYEMSSNQWCIHGQISDPMLMLY